MVTVQIMEQKHYWEERYARVFLSIPALATIFGLFIPNFVLFYIVVFTKYWYIPLLYVLWIFTLDRHTCETGGRGFSYIRKNLPLPKLPFYLRTSSSYTLDPKRNYLFCCFPHGLFPLGVLSVFSFEKGGFKNVFPNHTPYVTSLHMSYFFPILREILFLFGYSSASEKSLNYLLNVENGGRAIALFLGGSEEMPYASEKDYHIYLKKRRGFARIALKNGTPLVPVFSFGVNDVYKYPQNAFVLRLLNWYEKITGDKSRFCYGQGIFHDWYGFSPFIKPITTIVGEPIDVVKNENPTREEIEELYQKFTNATIKLFNDHKDKYVPNAETAKLFIV